MPLPSLCNSCKALNLTRKSFLCHRGGKWDSDRTDVVLRGQWGDLKASAQTCELCRLLEHTLRRNHPLFTPERSSPWKCAWVRSVSEFDYELSAEMTEQLGSGLCPVFTNETLMPTHCIQMIEAKPIEPFIATMALDTIDINMLKGWIGLCQTQHGFSCTSPAFQTSPEVVSTLMVDVKDKCLICADTVIPYVALSYVWGKTNMLKTQTRLLEAFGKPGAFEQQKPPRTIYEAMEVTAKLGYRYLWVDSLCIVQDEPGLKHQLIRSMAAIYGQADVTLVAASGRHADAGLSGWTRKSRAEFPMQSATIATDLVLGVIPDIKYPLNICDWARRGWTFQEGIFSARCLVFLNGRVVFLCRHACWREDLMTEGVQMLRHPASLELGRHVTGTTASEFYENLIIFYSGRLFTFPRDVVDAFTALQLGVLPLLRGTRIFHGLLSRMFDRHLLWTGFHGPFERLIRRPSSPSWSWMGWENQLGFLDTEPVLPWLLEKTWVDWYITEDEGLIPIWDPARDACLEPSTDLGRFSEDTARYGTPSPNNKFGRELVLPPLPNRPPLTTPKLSRPTPSSCLVFTTVFVSYTIALIPRNGDNDDLHMVIQDQEGSICGLVFDFYETDHMKLRGDTQTVGLVLISYAAIVPPSRCRVLYDAPARYPFFKMIELDPEAFHVMLIDQNGRDEEIYERIGLGILHINALWEGLSQPSWKQICLA